MLKISDAIELVNKIIDEFIDKLYVTGLGNIQRAIQFALGVLCRAKGGNPVLTNIEGELDVYNVKAETICDFVTRIKEACGDNANKVLPAAADHILLYKGRTMGPWEQFSQPKELTVLVQRLMHDKGCKRIYNPFAGIASYGMADFIERYYAQERDHSVYHFAKMRMYLNDIDSSFLEETDSIRDWNEHDADCIVSTPPFGGMLEGETKREFHARTYDEYLLSRFISGQAKYAFYVVPRGICFHSHATAFDLRKTICEKNLLEMVINLPSGIFSSTGISTSLLVLNRCRERGEKVVFVNAEDAFVKANRRERYLDVDAVMELLREDSSDNVCRVNSGELFDNDCSFDFSRYASQKLVVKDGQKIISLGDVLTLDKGELCKFQGDKVNNVLEASNFVDDVNKLSEVYNSVFVEQPKYKFCGPHLVVNMQGKIYIHKGPSEFYIGQALSRFVFKVDVNVVDMDYLAYVILQNRVLQRHYFGSGMARLDVKQLLKYNVVIDSLVKQKQIIGRINRTFLDQEKQRLGIREAGGDLSHMLGAPKDSIGNLIDLLMDSDHIDEEERGWLKAIDDNFNYMLRLINIVGADFSSLSENRTEIHIVEFLKEYVRALRNLKFSTCYKVKEFIYIDETVTIQGDADLIRVILDAAFRNAYKHGFDQHFNDENLVKLECKAVSYDGKPFVCITIANNGKPLPSGFSKEDFATPGKKAGKFGNTGKGGYHIYAIAKKYGGYINVSSSLEWPFMLDVLLPSENVSNYENIFAYGDKCL